MYVVSGWIVIHFPLSLSFSLFPQVIINMYHFNPVAGRGGEIAEDEARVSMPSDSIDVYERVEGYKETLFCK
jgi:hypothetical protein